MIFHRAFDPYSSLLFVVVFQVILLVTPRVAENENGADLWTLSWNAPFLSSPSGYGSEATSFMKGLREVRRNKEWNLAAGLAHGDLPNQVYLLNMDQNQVTFFEEIGLNQKTLNPKRTVVVCHSEPGAWSVPNPLYQSPYSCPPNPSQKYFKLIGRTMFETDRLPKDWDLRLNKMDEIWVPTTFMQKVMEEGGVTKPVHVLGQGIEVDRRWNPALQTNFSESEWKDLFRESAFGGCQPDHFKFLSVFKWEKRKAPDILLNAFWSAFDSTDGVCLVMVTSAYNDDPQTIPRQIQEYWEKRETHQMTPPSVTVLNNLNGELLTRLYANVQAFVLPSRGEGWGRPYMEAMAMGLPVIATNWSGPTEFITSDTGYLLPIHEELVDANLDAFPGHKWAEPITADLVELLKHISSNYAQAKAIGARARKHIADNWSHAAVARQLLVHLNRLVSGANLITNKATDEEL